MFQLFFFFFLKKANTDKIYNRFVHFDNLPEDGLQCVLCVGLQFGKVDHHVFISNKNKVMNFFLI